jgi:trans-aconitate methyltransferase
VKEGIALDISEFDRFADEYDQMHEKNIAVTSEKPEFFHEYKIRVLRQMAQARKLEPESILDFGSGIGNSTPFFRRYFPTAPLASADVSQRSLDVAESRFPGMATGLRIEGQSIPAKDDTFSITFSACVFHHIPHGEHVHWLRRIAPGHAPRRDACDLRTHPAESTDRARCQHMPV